MIKVWSVAALAIAYPCFAIAAKYEPIWFNTADLKYSIEVSARWPVPGPAGSISPPGMDHLFLLTPESRSMVMDIAVESKPGPDATPAGEWFDLALQLTHGSPMQTVRLKGGSELRYFKSIEVKPGRKDYFIQGTFAQGGKNYYFTLSSRKSYPSDGDWKDALAALNSIRQGPSTVGGVQKDLTKRNPPSESAVPLLR